MALFNGIRLGVGFLLHSLGVALRLARFAPAALLRAARPEGARKPTAGAPGGPLVAESNPLLLLYSQVAWHGVWQRPQEMALGLARRRRVLFVSPIQVHERLGRYARARTLERIDGGKGVTVFSPTIFSGEYRRAWVCRLNSILVDAELRRLLRGERHVTFLTNTPLAAPLLDRFPFRKVIYDVMDDFAAFDWAPATARESHERLLREADAVLTGTYTLLEDARAQGREATYAPCGVDYEAFAGGEATADFAEPAELRGLPRPILGYVGTLSERIDTRILSALAERFPQASLVLIGPVYRNLGEPPRAPNIRYLGLKPHSELPAYLHHFDVALMPFRLSDAARAINPVKALEYLAAGCVVVSTPIPDVVRFYSGVMLVAPSPEDFADKVEEALQGNHSDRIAKGRELARGATWDAMVEAVEAKI